MRPDMHNPGQSANRRLAFGLVGLVAFMIGLSYAAVPLYQLFCQVTGYGGTTQRADAASGTVLNRTVTVRFDASISSDLDWSFKPVQRQITLRVGENALAFYSAANRSATPLTGTATFNVTPEIAGSYFSKVDCFCFTEQTLQPGQAVDMPVSFYVDPAIVDDPSTARIEEITLSYTFFRSAGPGEASAAQPAAQDTPGTMDKNARPG